MRASIRILSLSVLTALFLISCSSQPPVQTIAGGDVRKGAAAIGRYGCGSCHIIPGVSEALGKSGPPLTGIGDRIYIAGVLQNTPGNMVRWIEDPHAVDEKTVMPNLGVTHQDAIDIAEYLYTLK